MTFVALDGHTRADVTVDANQIRAVTSRDMAHSREIQVASSMPELNRKALDLLQRELGLPDSLRFFSQLGVGAGNYTEERRALFAGLSIEEFRQAISGPVAPQTRSIQE